MSRGVLVRVVVNAGAITGSTRKTSDTRYLAQPSSSPNFSFLFRPIIYLFLVNSGSTLLTIFGGCVPDLYTFLAEERLPDGWESRVRDQMGLTIFTFNRTIFRVELGVEEEVEQPFLCGRNHAR